MAFPQEERQLSHSISQQLCRVSGNEHGQLQCGGCDLVCQLLRWGEVQKRRDTDFEGSSISRVIHSNYKELDMCARLYNCDTCQIIRRAFLLEQITGHDAEQLEDVDMQWPVHAVLDLRKSGDSLVVTIQSPSATLFHATVSLQSTRTKEMNNPTRAQGRVRANFHEMRQVVRDCHDNHECSSRHRWSNRNPSWLLEILGGGQVRVVKPPSHLVDYVVLSYSWGDPLLMPPSEWARIKGAATRSKNGVPVPERRNPFAMWQLPETMQDAITITWELGFRYIWIDSVCIPKGSNWDTEASMMHEVYGNAAFTLAACSATKATDRLLQDRLAWTHRNKGCKLRGQWLQNTEMTLDEVRLGSPVAQRAWTLQEERLSPRVLYWTGQRWYWSCPERQVTELSELGSPKSTLEKGTWSPPHRFLDLCRTGDYDQLHEEWFDLVEAYTRRDLCQSKDRFLAISGLAIRFFDAKADLGKTGITEEYLAGLWRDNFAKHLSWSVVRGVGSEKNLLHIAPSWSWASLPLCVHTKTKHEFTQSEHFQFIGTRYLSATGTGTTAEWYKSQLQELRPDFRESSQAVEERGRNVKMVEVQGRLRRFIGESSQKVAWSDIEWKRGGRDGFDFCAFPGRQLHARNLQDGRILSKEAHGGEVVGQLDYLPSSDPESCLDGDGSETKRLGVALEDGAEKDLMCLELGEYAMLLLQRNPGCVETYRRVGVCIGYKSRKGFFYGCETKNILLA